ncbi:nucleolar protein 58 isoform X2 [Wyeomyia smithii]|nr:nucleolar protein 58 isoform X2 [Wyeomyia smithii]
MSAADLSDILPEELEEKVKEAAEISMGTEISEEDIMNIQHLCDEILSINEYRTHLYDYLKTRMMAMAPNLTVLVGETIGARLIAHAGSLVNLAKHPSSTVQILGAEKALFRALKTKKDTPKYGLIFHASLIGSASSKNKGKISRSLAAKASLATRMDAFGEDVTMELGTEHRVKLELRLKMLEEGNMSRLSGTGKAKANLEKYHSESEIKVFKNDEDNTLPITKKRKLSDEIDSEVKIKHEATAEYSLGEPSKEKKQYKDANESSSKEHPSPKKIKPEKEEPSEDKTRIVEKKKKKKKKRDSEAELHEVPQQEKVDTLKAGKKKKLKNCN